MVEIFVNYRTGDEENVAALLEHELSRRFESGVFFRAAKSIPPGDDYEKALVTAVRRSSALLAVIGPRWLEVCGKDKLPKIEDESDWTRREILEAFDCGIRVIPILVGPAKLLGADDLPAALSALATCQYTRLRSRDLEADLDRLAVDLSKLVPELKDKKIHAADAAGAAGSIVNNVYDQAQVGVQGNVTGNIDFGNFGMTRNDRDGR
jgi:TIR domain